MFAGKGLCKLLLGWLNGAPHPPILEFAGDDELLQHEVLFDVDFSWCCFAGALNRLNGSNPDNHFAKERVVLDRDHGQLVGHHADW